MKAGHEVTLYSDRSAAQWLHGSRPTGTAARFELALAYERELGLAHWEDVAPKARGGYITFCPERGNRLATMTGRASAYVQAVDLRLQSHRWMNDLEAAGGRVIVEKIDGNFDRDCAIAGNGGFNAVFVQQDDGLTAWYLHMKNGSQTSKAIGERVAAGEFLGLVGSSGPSNLPHLHFELHDAANNVVDPLHGTCNAAPDRWIVPQPYESPRIDTLTTHSAEPTLVECGVANGVPVHEEPHFADSFAPGATFWAFASYSDHRNGEVTHFSVLRPDASVETSWDFDLASQNLPKPFYSGTAWDWSVTLPTDAPAGTWMLQAEFQGQTYQHAFAVTAAAPARGHSHHARPAREPQIRR